MADLIHTIHRAIEFIEDRLRAEVDVAAMAGAANLSLFYFVRAFNQMVRHTPYEYLVRRRLTESAIELVQTERKIIDLAIEFGFHSHEVYARSFKRMFGLQPSEYRAQGTLDPRFLLSQRTLQHLIHFNREDFHPPRRLELAAIPLAGLMTRPTTPSGDSSLWRVFYQELQAERISLPDRRFFEVTCYPAGWTTGGPFNLIGVTLPASQPGPPLVSFTVPGGVYACFCHRGGALALTRDYIYQTWLPKSGYQLSGSFEVGMYACAPPLEDKGDQDIDIYIPVRGTPPGAPRYSDSTNNQQN